MEELLTEILENLLSTGNTKLDDQIKYMEGVNKLMRTPITIAILNSLKELKGIKNKTLNIQYGHRSEVRAIRRKLLARDKERERHSTV